jgi:general secretion pathway protein B
MSILLDALRKSEEQRRLGSAPSIHDGADSSDPGGDSAHQWIPLSLIVLSAIVMIWLGWRQYAPPLAGTPADAVTGADQVVAADAPQRPRAQGRTPVESYANEVRAPQAHAGPAQVRAPADDVRAPQVHAGSARDRAVANAQKARVNESFRAYEGEGEPAGREAPERDAAVAMTAPDVVVEPPPARRPGGNPAPQQSRPSSPEKAASEPITFWELPQGVRDSMPELRISVLVFAKQPEDRFLLISGQRLVEKEELEGGVVLDEIRRDGAVFRYRNYRFLVKG